MYAGEFIHGASDRINVASTETGVLAVSENILLRALVKTNVYIILMQVPSDYVASADTTG